MGWHCRYMSAANRIRHTLMANKSKLTTSCAALEIESDGDGVLLARQRECVYVWGEESEKDKEGEQAKRTQVARVIAIQLVVVRVVVGSRHCSARKIEVMLL